MRSASHDRSPVSLRASLDRTSSTPTDRIPTVASVAVLHRLSSLCGCGGSGLHVLANICLSHIASHDLGWHLSTLCALPVCALLSSLDASHVALALVRGSLSATLLIFASLVRGRPRIVPSSRPHGTPCRCGDARHGFDSVCESRRAVCVVRRWGISSSGSPRVPVAVVPDEDGCPQVDRWVEQVVAAVDPSVGLQPAVWPVLVRLAPCCIQLKQTV